MMRIKGKFIFMMLMILLLAACGINVNFGEESLGSKPLQEKDKEAVTLVLAVFDENTSMKKQVTEFNERNNAYQIIIKQYTRSEIPEEDGLLLLQRELATGEGPDIIDFGREYSTSDIVGEYTENLFPYFEKEASDKFFPNILKAFAYRDKLYAMPVDFTLETFAGSKAALNGREHWNIQEMMDCYLEKESDMVLYPGQSKRDVFGTILTGSMEYYIDWEQGNCDFDGVEFQKMLSFCNLFPDALQITDEYSVKNTFLNGEALLLPMRLNNVYDICAPEYIFGEEVISYIGFPVEGVSGTVIKPGASVLAISANCENKDTAWQFIYSFFTEAYQKEIENGFPVCKSALEQKLKEAQKPEYITDAEGCQIMKAKYRVMFEGEEPIEIYALMQKQADLLWKLIEGAQISTATDRRLYSLLLEEAGGYFAGDKTLEETIAVIQSRAKLYVGERVK